MSSDGALRNHKRPCGRFSPMAWPNASGKRSLVKILLIHPQNLLQRHSTGIYGRSLRYAPLTMPTLKALVPADLDAEVRIVDEMVEDLDFNTPADLVAITAITGTALRA